MTVGQSLADFLHRERVPAGLIDRPGRQLIWPPGCAKLRRCSARIAPMRTFDCIGGREANLILDFLRRSRYQLATLSGPCASGLARRIPLPLRTMTEHLIDIDDDLLAAAQRELNTTGVSDTVRRALEYVTTTSARARQVAWPNASAPVPDGPD